MIADTATERPAYRQSCICGTMQMLKYGKGVVGSVEARHYTSQEDGPCWNNMLAYATCQEEKHFRGGIYYQVIIGR
jgi:hypothetical protein